MQIVQGEKTNQRSYPSISPLILGAAQGVSLKKRYLCFLKSLHFLRFVGISDCPLWIIFQRNVVFRPRSIVGGVLKLPKERVKATPDYYWSIGRNFYKRIISGSIFSFLYPINAPGGEELLVAEAQVPFSHHVSCVAPRLRIFQLDHVKLFQELIKHHVSL